MKRITVLLLMLCLLTGLTACGKTPPAETTAATEAATTQATEATEATEVATQPTEVTVPETTAAPQIIRHPLNGEILDEAWEGRPTIVVINNIRDALPHHGVSQADILYEIETEGGITRCLAVFSDLSQVDKLGPVRSSRTYFNNVAVSYDAPLVHCGGSGAALRANYDDSGASISNWIHINEATNGSYFYRDYDRYNNRGYDWEHTLFTTGENLTKALSDFGYNTTSDRSYGLEFSELPALDGTSGEEVTVTFRGGKTTTMTYNVQRGLYEASQYGSDYVDANTGERMTFRNILVLYAKQTFIYDGDYDRSYYDIIGSGKGHLAMDGILVPILWNRENLEDPFTYTYEDGTPVILGVGTSYIAIVDQNKTVTAN